MKILERFPKYTVSNDGEVYTFFKNRAKRLTPDRQGYLTVSVTDGFVRKTVKVHRLVAEQYLDNPDNLPIVNHLNGDVQDNRVENLEWCTSSQNQIHAHSIGLSTNHGSKVHTSVLKEKDIPVILKMRNSGHTYRSIAEKFGTSLTPISRICRGEAWRFINE